MPSTVNIVILSKRRVIHFGSIVTWDNKIPEEIIARLISGNRVYCGLLGHFNSRLVTYGTKHYPFGKSCKTHTDMH